MPQTVHVYPNNDLIEHDTDGGDCPCGPTLFFDADGACGWVITHHSPTDVRPMSRRWCNDTMPNAPPHTTQVLPYTRRPLPGSPTARRRRSQSVSDVVRKALERYVKAGRRKRAQRGDVTNLMEQHI